MLRYCPNCDKRYDFAIKNMKELDHLICPGCGQPVDKNSFRSPDADRHMEEVEENIGSFIMTVWGLVYWMYGILSLIGIIAYFTGRDHLLYGTAIVLIVVYLLQFMRRSVWFRWGIVLLPLGAAAGYFLAGGVRGACLGLFLVYAGWYIYREILYKLFRWLISIGNR